MDSDDIRVRIAPSPTGFFHVGSARTALYNWLFARHHNGKFILRVEDTDIARSSEKMIKVILDGLEWLGLNWDEEIYFQSKRLKIYESYMKMLIEKGRAYYCYCDPQALEKERQEAYKKKINWQYDRRCLKLSDAERAKKEKLKIPKAVRFLVPDKPIIYNDLIHGEIRREAKDVEDFVIMRHNNIPTYNLACVVDDHEMKISHVIRAVDHITNTPKQILLYNALGLSNPEFAHLPLILGEDKTKLSKRHGAVSLTWYKQQGFLCDALVNYLALLGWSPGDDQEIMKKNELINRFSLERINPANAVFDINKLEWMNQKYIMQLQQADFQKKVKPFIIKSHLMTEEEIKRKKQWYMNVCDLMQPRLKKLSDIDENGRYFFKDDFKHNMKILDKYLNPETLGLVKEFALDFEKIHPFEATKIEIKVRTYATVHNLKASKLIHPLRAFITGNAGGPPLFDTMELIGKERCVRRIQKIIDEYGEFSD